MASRVRFARSLAVAALSALLAAGPAISSAQAKSYSKQSSRSAGKSHGKVAAKSGGKGAGKSSGKSRSYSRSSKGSGKVAHGRGRWHGAWRDRAAKAKVATESRAAKSAAILAAAAAAENPPPVKAAIPAAPPITGQALVAVATGGVTSTSARIASDLASVLDGDNLRVLPVMSRGSLADLLALAQLDKADLAFLHSDALTNLSAADRASLSNRISYVARLYNEEIHVVASRDIPDIRALAGKKVNVGLAGSANAQTAQIVFGRLGITPDYAYLDQPTALAQLASGEIAGDVLVSGRPVKALQDFAGDGRFKLLSIPYDSSLQDIYLPARIEAVDYGNLVPRGTSVDTLAVAIVLATVDANPGSVRAQRVERFTQRLFDRFDSLREPTRHPKWRDVNLAAEIANWNRFAAAQSALESATARSVGLANPVGTAPVNPSNASPSPQEDSSWKPAKAN